MCLAYGKICKPLLGEKYMFLLNDEAGKKSDLPISLQMVNLSIVVSLHVFHFPLGL